MEFADISGESRRGSQTDLPPHMDRDVIEVGGDWLGDATSSKFPARDDAERRLSMPVSKPSLMTATPEGVR
jgi:hypothetical protein